MRNPNDDLQSPLRLGVIHETCKDKHKSKRINKTKENHINFANLENFNRPAGLENGKQTNMKTKCI